MAVGTAIGVACDQLKRDINGWDILYRSRDTDTEDSRQLAVQLKCTVERLHRIDSGRTLSFQLDALAYDHLRKSPTHPPRLLVVVELRDRTQNRWIEPRLESLLLHGSAWYASLAGLGPLPMVKAQRRSTSPRYSGLIRPPSVKTCVRARDQRHPEPY